jgi:hypothetical protein
MSLPAAWVDRVFEKLMLSYGHDFLRRWEGLDLEKVKADWAHELSGFEKNPDAIKHALMHLPAGQPPTVMQFRALCIGRPDAGVPALPAPKASPEMVQLAKAAVINRSDGWHPKAWAHRLRSREQKLDRLTPAQRAMWRAAIATESA